MHFRLIIFLSILFSLGLVVSSIFFTRGANAETVTTSVTVTICGNSVVEGSEQCDDGGTVSGDGCSSSCQLEGPVCGNGDLEDGEQCDDGNGFSGDGCNAVCRIEGENNQFKGPSPPPTLTKVILEGKAYPYATVTILQDGKKVEVCKAEEDASFKAELGNINPGTYTFGVYAEDSRGLRSITFTFSTNISSGTVTTIGGILIPPTISIDKFFGRLGETFVISGSSAPDAIIEVVISGPNGAVRHQAIAQPSGEWKYSFITSSGLTPGKYSVMAKATSKEKLLSIYSNSIEFIVQEAKELPEKPDKPPFPPPVSSGPCPGSDFNL